MTAVEWSENFTLPAAGSVIEFSAASYNQWVEGLMPEIKGIKPSSLRDLSNSVGVGDFNFYVAALPTTYKTLDMLFRPVKRRSALELVGSKRQISYCQFDGTVSIPILADHRGDPWMSLTPNEVASQRKLVQLAKGNSVAVLGMGLGWLAQRVLEKDRVSELTVIDKDAAVLEFFGKRLKTIGEELGKAVTLIHADAYEVDLSQYDQTLWDIWKRMGDAGDDERFVKIWQSLRQQKKSCHAWFFSKPTDYALQRLRRKKLEASNAV